jgi:hydroxymethylpyrimidine pyrophosphatase-like HAD family hydrolase
LVDDLRAMVASLPVYAFSVVACPEETALREVRDELVAASGVGMVNVFPDKVFGGWTLDSAPKGVNKWSGVEAFCRYGDGDNDVELFERAAHSCAMSHATDRAKAAAHVTLSDGLDGWAQLLDYL